MHIFDNVHERRRILTVRHRVRGQERVSAQLLPDDVLEDDAADGDAERGAEAAEEGVGGDGEGDVVVLDAGLDGKGHGRVEDAEAEARGQVEEDPGGDRGAHVEEVHEARAEGGESPADPEEGAVFAADGDEDADEEGGGGDGEGLGEDGEAADEGRVSFDRFEVEGEVVQLEEDLAGHQRYYISWRGKLTYYETVKESSEEGNSRRPGAEDTESE